MEPLLVENSCSMFTYEKLTSPQCSATYSGCFVNYCLLTLLLWMTQLHHFLQSIHFSVQIKSNLKWIHLLSNSAHLTIDHRLQHREIKTYLEIREQEIVIVVKERESASYPNSKANLMDEISSVIYRPPTTAFINQRTLKKRKQKILIVSINSKKVWVIQIAKLIKWMKHTE